MAKKGGTKHLKKLAAPRSWPIQKKDSVWVTKPRAGPHATEESIPLKIIIRNILEYAKTSFEATKVIKAGKLLIDGKVCKDPKRGIGLMDIISIPILKEHYRAIYNQKGKIVLQKIKENETKTKLCKIKNKKMNKKGITQLNLHDGRNVLILKGTYKTGDVIEISLPEQKIKTHYELKKGNTALIIGGKHTGETGKVSKIHTGTINRRPLITLKTKTSELITPKEYVFIIGKEKPLIKIGD